MKILLVDDERLMCSSLTSVLQALDKDYDVVSFSGVSCAKQAIKWLEQNKPGYCIFDVLLNGVSGIDLAKKVVSLYGDSIKIKLITGCALDSSHFKDLKTLVETYTNMTYVLKRDASIEDSFIDGVINGVTTA